MIVLLCALVGILLGLATARRRGGNRLDLAQYAAVYGIALAILGVVLTLIVDRAL